MTVDTIFHKTKIDLGKWYIAIPLIIKPTSISSRQLSKQIDVNKNTACRMIGIVKKAYLNKDELLINILEYDK